MFWRLIDARCIHFVSPTQIWLTHPNQSHQIRVLIIRNLSKNSNRIFSKIQQGIQWAQEIILAKFGENLSNGDSETDNLWKSVKITDFYMENFSYFFWRIEPTQKTFLTKFGWNPSKGIRETGFFRRKPAFSVISDNAGNSFIGWITNLVLSWFIAKKRFLITWTV